MSKRKKYRPATSQKEQKRKPLFNKSTIILVVVILGVLLLTALLFIGNYLQSQEKSF